MPSIEEDKLFTAMVEFTVEPARQQSLIDDVTGQIARHFGRYAGFVSSSFHASEDGRRVINYGQWESREAWEAFDRENGKDEVGAAVKAAVKRHGATAALTILRVARVIELKDAGK